MAALAATPEQHQEIAKVFEELTAKRKQLQQEWSTLEKQSAAPTNLQDEVTAAPNLAHYSVRRHHQPSTAKESGVANRDNR